MGSTLSEGLTEGFIVWQSTKKTNHCLCLYTMFVRMLHQQCLQSPCLVHSQGSHLPSSWSPTCKAQNIYLIIIDIYIYRYIYISWSFCLNLKVWPAATTKHKKTLENSEIHSCWCSTFRFCVALRPQKPSGLLGTRSSNPLRISFLFKSCGLWTLPCNFVPHN